MILINFLPWRREKIKLKKRKSLLIFAISIIAGFFLGFLIHFINSNKIKEDLTLKSEYAFELKDKENELQLFKKLQEENQILNENIQLMQFQQTEFNQMVEIFEDLPGWLPRGVVLTKISETQGQFIIEGLAASQKNIYRMMANLAKASSIKEVHLEDTQIDDKTGREVFKVGFSIF